MRNDGYPMIEYRATTLNFSEPTKLLDALMRDGRIHHDGSQVARWCISNVVGHYDKRSNIYPNKARPEAKIDCAIATIMALGASLGSRSMATSTACRTARAAGLSRCTTPPTRCVFSRPATSWLFILSWMDVVSGASTPVTEACRLRPTARRPAMAHR
jgi:hypothetical protein